MLNHAIQTAVREREMEVPIHKRMMDTLAALADENGEILQSSPEIAAHAKASKVTTLRVLHELHDRGDITILNPQRVRGHYRINHLPTEEKPRIDSLRMSIADAIRRLPLPVSISFIFQALAKYASRSGNNIFPSVKTLMRDTCYTKKTIQLTVRWLLCTDFIRVDPDCINPKYQARGGYLIPGWNANAQMLMITPEQIEQIKVLHRQHNRQYWEKLEEGKTPEASLQDASTWLEEHSLDLDLDACENEDEQWFDNDGEVQDEEELSVEEEESVPAAAVRSALLDIQDDGKEELAPTAEEQEEGQGNGEEEREEQRAPIPFLRPRQQRPSEMFRAAMRPQRKPVPITPKQYHAARKAIEPHMDIVENHDNGTTLVDEATLRKSLAVLSFYERTITLYEEQQQQRE
jgi:hypothetical protein